MVTVDGVDLLAAVVALVAVMLAEHQWRISRWNRERRERRLREREEWL